MASGAPARTAGFGGGGSATGEATGLGCGCAATGEAAGGGCGRVGGGCAGLAAAWAFEAASACAFAAAAACSASVSTAAEAGAAVETADSVPLATGAAGGVFLQPATPRAAMIATASAAFRQAVGTVGWVMETPSVGVDGRSVTRFSVNGSRR